jgi:UDP-N-acetylmuramoylalanine--D-glutamate ligase
MDASAYFQGKKITVMGLGLLGRGVGDVRYLAQAGADLIVTDLKSREELAPSLAALAEYKNIHYTLGEHKLEDFRDRDLILKAPKTPLDSLYLQEAEKNGIPITMSTALFARFAREAGAALIGITGTRGKTTTTEMIAHVLRTAGKQVVLGGNVRGISTLALLPEIAAGTVTVLELDSWQLQGFRAEELSPHISVFTTLYADHQDYYEGMSDYLADKAEIFLHQGPDDVLVLGEQAAPLVLETYGEALVSTVIVAKSETITEDILKIPGVHNRVNAACALAAAEAYGVLRDVACEALASFTGVAGRLELVREKDGVKFYNDTTATTPEATLAALEALDTETKNIVLIMGGSDKGLDMNRLLVELPNHTKRIILLAGTGTNRVLEFVTGASVFDSLAAAFAEAVRATLCYFRLHSLPLACLQMSTNGEMRLTRSLPQYDRYF